jgi:hypothetical protein
VASAEELRAQAIGQPLPRLDGVAKVTGMAPYAYEQKVESASYLHPVQATIARGRITGIDTAAAESVEGVLGVLTHHNAPTPPLTSSDLLVGHRRHAAPSDAFSLTSGTAPPRASRQRGRPCCRVRRDPATERRPHRPPTAATGERSLISNSRGLRDQFACSGQSCRPGT